MSEGKQLRLGQVARKLNVGRNTIISYLHDKGYEIDSNPNTKIDDSLFRILENAFEDSAVEKKVASNIKIGLEEKSETTADPKKDLDNNHGNFLFFRLFWYSLSVKSIPIAYPSINDSASSSDFPVPSLPISRTISTS